MKYKTLLWDIDGTLLNFEKSEEMSMHRCLEKYNVSITEAQFENYKNINKECWKAIEKDHTRRKELMAKRFNDFFKQLNVEIEGDLFNEEYQKALGTYYYLNDGALEVIQTLKPLCRQYAASNGSTTAQMGKLKGTGLYDLFDGLFISEQIGYEKPDVAFFNYIQQKVNYDPTSTLIIGDSLTSDMQGGINSHIDTCYFNPYRNKNEQVHTTYEISQLKDILKIVQ